MHTPTRWFGLASALLTAALAAQNPNPEPEPQAQPQPQAPAAPTAPAVGETALHKALTGSPLVVVGRHQGVATHGDGIRLHRVHVLEVIKSPGRGDPPQAVTLIDLPEASFHNRPVPHQTRLFCLLDASRAAARAGLAENRGPYYRLSGHPGSNPAVFGDRATHPHVAFARILGDGLSRRPLQDSSDALIEVLNSDEPTLRWEAAQVLTEHRTLRDKITEITWSQLASRAIGETDDPRFKIALGGLCAAEGVPGLIEGLCLSLPSTDDVEFALFLGRAARATLGDNGSQLLQAHATAARQKVVRDRFLLAMGATGDKRALDALLQMHQQTPEDQGVVDALKAHGSPRAREAVDKR